ncbi:hypothetical protein [Cellulomonas fimi]|uniref:Peptidase S33 tripeptidyl aminopeptidase-like C-terminal domain-containing protein n=1 Tax=Cellulomonas fimi TaxID=1708 RepID=A0A7Y0QHP4_CELFI|nr:hypothetical protein [Cellulomonas fimi]NMR20505.1 hypothetical protein [Cellulomonas fimi]
MSAAVTDAVSDAVTDAVVDAVNRPVPTSWAPQAAVRGTVVVLPGRGEGPQHYARLGRRLSGDGYQVEVLLEVPDDAAALEAAWAGLDAPLVGPVVVVAADASAGAAVESVVTGRVVPDGLVLAGAVVGDGRPAPADADVVASRTTCPVHRGVWESTAGDRADELRRTSAAARRWAEAAGAWRVGLPALVLHGAADPLSPVDAVVGAVRSWPAASVLAVRGGVHDVLNDAAHRSVAAAVVQFLEDLRGSRVAAPGAAPGGPLLQPVDLGQDLGQELVQDLGRGLVQAAGR